MIDFLTDAGRQFWLDRSYIVPLAALIIGIHVIGFALRILPGRSNKQLAEILGQTNDWVRRQIDAYALVDCIQYQSGGRTRTTPVIKGEGNAAKETNSILAEQRKSLRKQDGFEERKAELVDEYADQLGLDESDKKINAAMLDRIAESYMATEAAPPRTVADERCQSWIRRRGRKRLIISVLCIVISIAATYGINRARHIPAVRQQVMEIYRNTRSTINDLSHP